MPQTGLAAVPYDVCEYMSHYLSDSDLSTLRKTGINNAFNDLSMLRRYKQLTLSTCWSHSQHSRQGKLKGFSLSSAPSSYHHPAEIGPDITRHVRSLRLIFQPEGKDNVPRLRLWGEHPVCGIDIPSTRVVKSPMNSPSIKLSSTPPSPSVRLTQITSLFGRLSRLEELHIILVLPPPYGLPHSYFSQYGRLFGPVLRPLIPPILNSIRLNLRSLSICVPIEAWDLVFTPSLHFRQLEALEIHFDKISQISNSIINSKILLPFLKRHARTIQTLKLVRPYGPFYTNFTTFPLLQKVEIVEDQYFGARVPSLQSHFHTFLQSHCDTIKQIEWKMQGHVDQIFSDRATRTTWFDLRHHTRIPFPQLRTLELKSLDQLSQIQLPPEIRLRELLSSYRHSLTKLCLENYEFELGAFDLLLEAISSAILEHLGISLHYLASEIFCILAKHLPNLRVLGISYRAIYSCPLIPSTWEVDGDGVCSEPIVPSQNPALFLQELGLIYLSEWGLRELNLDVKGKDANFNAWEICRGVVLSLPSLFTINDMSIGGFLGG